MPNLLLSFESPSDCNLVASVLTAAQATGQQISGVRAANLLQRLTGGCVVYGPLPDGRWLPDAGPQSPGSPDPSATHTPNTPTADELIAMGGREYLLNKNHAENTERIWCAQCGKPVSTPVPKPTIVRAWVECPECIAKVAGTDLLIRFDDPKDCAAAREVLTEAQATKQTPVEDAAHYMLSDITHKAKLL